MRFAWILGVVCRWIKIQITSRDTYPNYHFRETKEMFFVRCPQNKRDKATLDQLILDNVEIGTKIISDGWAAYKGLSALEYE